MFDIDHRSDDSHGLDLLSYMYDELDERAREKFESHLAFCDECAVELGAISDARLGMIEWRRNDFEPLATPAIIIPDEPAAVAVQRAKQKNGFLDGLIEAIASLSVTARAGFALAAAAVLVAMVYFAFAPHSPQPDVAKEPTAPIKSSDSERGITTPPTNEQSRDILAKSTNAGQTGPSATKPNDRKPPARRSVPADQLAAVHSTRSPKNMHGLASEEADNLVKSAPRLNSTDDEEDTTLRLSDLFSQVGSRKK